ncbi:MAG: substrate-binding domain-containing protein, partial [bacterium]
GGAVQTFIQPLAASFRGEPVKVEFQPMGKLVKALAEGYPADMVIVTQEVLAKLALQGKPVARVGVGVGVHESAPAPDISSVEAFRRTLLAAKSVIYMDPEIGTSGKHVAEVLSRLGIESELRPKTILGQGGQVAEAVGRGEVELALHQISEILPVKGVTLVGPLPKDLQKITVYSAGLATRTGAPEAARAFIAFVTRPAFKAKFAAAGLDYRE